ncbi:MAG: hypothetical protein J5661_07545 [Bacteroidaceae bacterium]|nr:hypothetical protein [Bacteroidaceae bacterium]
MNAIKCNWVRVLTILLAVILMACGGGSRKDKKDQIKYEIRKVEAETRVYNIYIPASLHGLSEVQNHYEGIQALINLYTALGGF